MTRKSTLRALLISICAMVTVAGAALAGAIPFAGTGRSAFAAPTPLELYLDCSPSPGIQPSCTLPSGTTSVDVSVVLKNNSGAGVKLATMNFTAVTNQQTVMNPTAPACSGAGLDCNPDFDQAAITGSWNCSGPLPRPDFNPSPTIAQSDISCANGSGDGPILADGATITLGTVHYATTDGTASVDLSDVNVFDDTFSEVLSCNPVVSTAGDCFGVSLIIGGPTDTPTNTPTPTITPTATATPTVTNTPSTPDSDGDGLNDVQEALLGTNPNNPDTDNDGLTDGQEVNTTLTDPLNMDTDGDGLKDGKEVNITLTNPLVPDTDGDGLNDGQEVNTTLTNPLNVDSDGDGVHDGAEVNTFGTNPNNPDTDGDGLNDLQELVIGTNPLLADTDGDTLSDGLEVLTLGTSPFLADTDGDGLNDNVEVNTTLTDPKKADTDADGLKDGQEVNTTGTSPTNPDTDGDGVTDGAEVITYNSNPLVVDTDGDSMPDGFEVVNLCLNVLVADGAADPDLDAVQNLPELAQSTLPCNPDTDADGFKDKPSASHIHINTDPAIDNCITVANSGQLNSDGDFIDLPPAILFDDLTNPRSDALGDACDPDADNDGLLNTTETAGAPCASASGPTLPLNNDTDNDRSIDGAECALGFNPNSAASFPPNSPPGDADHDGLDALTEAILGTNPANPDTDGDGLLDGVEVKGYGANPLVTDSDGDGCSDAKEAAGLNNDRVINSGDQGLLAAHFGPGSSPNYLKQLDINKDGAINSGDQGIMSSKIGPC